MQKRLEVAKRLSLLFVPTKRRVQRWSETVTYHIVEHGHHRCLINDSAPAKRDATACRRAHGAKQGPTITGARPASPDLEKKQRTRIKEEARTKDSRER